VLGSGLTILHFARRLPHRASHKQKEGLDMGYIDHKTDLFADAGKKVDQFTRVSKKVETHDGMFFAIIAAVFVISSGMVWLHDIGTIWRMPTW
jgi:hypothetical protein